MGDSRPTIVAILAALVTIVTLIATAIKREWWLSTFSVASILAVLTFIPALKTLMLVLAFSKNSDNGISTYTDFASINNFRIDAHLPPTATDISVVKTSFGLKAQFNISKDSLEQWVEETWRQQGSHTNPEDREKRDAIGTHEFNQRFEHLDWKAPLDGITYYGPRAPNGTGYVIWYSESEGVAFEYSAFF